MIKTRATVNSPPMDQPQVSTILKLREIIFKEKNKNYSVFLYHSQSILISNPRHGYYHRNNL